ncbi:hypothetical protein G7Y89_g35 [Cudoniella acicularis]|uniref:WSC domain-containing protein n=1 Tax=Cudoniella acicularis TaxID=354080 RepID=A0A8H4RYW4_9HELO|nr:hypothetical protein G7Y89_g35 [Cudoniella acicularis]
MAPMLFKIVLGGLILLLTGPNLAQGRVVVQKRDLEVPTGIPTPWAYVGCWIDKDPTLDGSTLDRPDGMTNENGIELEVNPGPGLWSFVGCYTEGTTSRALETNVDTLGGGDAMTVEVCTSACLDAGYDLAGLEFDQECWCGNSIQNGAAPAPDGLAQCNMLCKGNSTEYCGGGGYLQVYDYNNQVTVTPYFSTTISSSV